MLTVDFGYSPWFLLLCIAIAIGLTYWMYAKITAEIQPWIKWLLKVLRFSAVFLILVLLLEPLFTTILQEKNKPIVVVLADGSESMVANKDSANIRQKIPNLLKAIKSSLENDDYSFSAFRFGNDVEKLQNFDTLRYNFAGTDIGNALNQINDRFANQNLGGIVLLSDGISTTGENPINTVENFKVPIFAVLTGDTNQTRDLLIESVLYNELSYVNTETPIGVNLRGRNIGSTSIKVNLYQKGKLLDTKTVALSTGNPIGKAEFNVKLLNSGIEQYEVTVDELPNEINYQNNRQLLFIKVLETRLKVALFANAPHPDVGALKKCLTKENRYQLTSFVRKSETEFYENPNINDFGSYNLFIFHNFPHTPADKSILDKIYAEARNRKVPIMHFVGSETRLNIHPQQKDFMAIVPTRASSLVSEAFLNILPNYKNHSSYRFPDENQFRKWLESAPPLLRNDSEWQAKPDAIVYGNSKIKGIVLDYPMFAIQENPSGKNMVFLGENFWRYRMHNYAEYGNFDLFDEWMYNLIQWLATKSDNRKFKVYTTKTVYGGDERVIFKGQVYDESYKPVSGAEVKVTLKDANNQATDYFLRETQTGNYSLELSNLTEGTYDFNATGSVNNKTVGTDFGQFSVGHSAIEYVQLQANANLMKQIALRTEGKFYELNNAEQIVKDIVQHQSIKPVLDYRKTTQSLHRFILPIALILLFLSLEWIIRKRNSLI